MAPSMMIVNNSSNMSSWSLKTGYTKRLSYKEYPLRAYNIGRFAGLTVMLSSDEEDFQMNCQGTEQGLCSNQKAYAI